MSQPCGWRVWQEIAEPHQWIGQCNLIACTGGIRCNDKAAADKFKDERMTCWAETHPVTPRDPQPPSQGTIFRRRLELLRMELLRMELGIRCETCQFFQATDSLHRCTLKMDWTGRSDWCESWQEKDDTSPETAV